jgi:hypothetical protein
MLEYITAGENGTNSDYIELPCMLTPSSVVQFTVNYQQSNGNKFLSTEADDGDLNEWRVFAYGDYSLFSDIGGGDSISGGRFECYDTFDAINQQYGTIEIGLTEYDPENEPGAKGIYQKIVSTGDTFINSVESSFTGTSPDKLRYYGSEYTWLKEVKVYANGLSGGLTYDFVAAKVGNNPGLYDTVNGEMYYATSGTMIAGPELQ